MYLKKTITYGNRKEIRKYHTLRYDVKGEKRSERVKPTAEQIQKYNDREALRKLKRLMINNFGTGDWHLILTYPDGSRPDPEEGKKNFSKFIKKLRRFYQKQGRILKYIYVTEYKNSNLHHHIVINDISGIGSMIRRLWPGGAFFSPLYEDQNFDGLAEYFVKETKDTFRDPGNPWHQRYGCSRNLEKPDVKTEIIRADSWRENPGVPPTLAEQGYVLDKESVICGFDGMGYPFQEYIFIKYENEKGDGGWTGRRQRSG